MSAAFAHDYAGMTLADAEYSEADLTSQQLLGDQPVLVTFRTEGNVPVLTGVDFTLGSAPISCFSPAQVQKWFTAIDKEIHDALWDAN